MAKLDIRVTKSGGAGATPASIARIQDTIAKALEKQNKLLTNQVRLNAANGKKAQASAEGTLRALSTIALRGQKTADILERSMTRAAVRTAQKWGVAALKIRRSLTAAFAGIGRSLSRAGAGIGGVLGGLFSGGSGAGGLLRGAGGLARVGTQLAGGLVSSLTKGLTGLIPVVGGALGSMLSGAIGLVTGVAGGVLQAAGELGGAIADKITRTLKIGLVAGLGIAFLSLRRAIKRERVQAGFEGFAKSVGTTSVEAMKRFQKAAQGTISKLDLIEKFNQAVSLGAADGVKAFESLIVTSRRLSKATGRDLDDAFSRLTLAIGKNERRLLDEIGIVVRARDAQLAYAKSVRKSVKDLTAQDKVLAFSQEVFRVANAKIKAMGKEVNTASDDLARMRASTADAADAIGFALLPSLVKIVQPLARVIRSFEEWVNIDVDKIADRLSSSIKGLTGILGNLAEVAESKEGFGGVITRITESFELMWKKVTILAGGAAKAMVFFMRSAMADIKALLLDMAESAGDMFANIVPGGKLSLKAVRAASGSASSRARGRASSLRTGAGLALESARAEAGSIRSLAPLNRGPSGSGGGQPSGVVNRGGLSDLGGGGLGGIGGSPKLLKNIVGAVQFLTDVSTVFEGVQDLPIDMQESIQRMFESVKDSEEFVTRISKEAARKRAKMPAEKLKAETKVTKAKLDADKKTLRLFDKLTKQASTSFQNAMARIDAESQRFAADFERGMQAISARLTDSLRRVASSAESLRSGFASGSELGATEGLPTPVRRALAKEKKEKLRRRRRLFRIASEGKGSEELRRTVVRRPVRDETGAIERDADGRPLMKRIRLLDDVLERVARAEAKLNGSLQTAIDAKLAERDRKELEEERAGEVVKEAIDRKAAEDKFASDKKAIEDATLKSGEERAKAMTELVVSSKEMSAAQEAFRAILLEGITKLKKETDDNTAAIKTFNTMLSRFKNR